MRNTIFLLFPILLIFFSCDKDKIPVCEDCDFTCLDQSPSKIYTNNCRDNWECDFKIMTQSKVDLTETQGVASGNKTVFQMVRNTEGEEDIADDEVREILVFELDATQESFSIEDDELGDMNVYFRQICFCVDVDFKPIIDGCLQGEKQEDGTWFVQAYFGEMFEFGIDARFEN